jgi:hypothetical protein
MRIVRARAFDSLGDPARRREPASGQQRLCTRQQRVVLREREGEGERYGVRASTSRIVSAADEVKP